MNAEAARRRLVGYDYIQLCSHFYTRGIYGLAAYTVFTNISLSA